MHRPWLKCYESGISESLDYPDHPLTTFLKKSSERYPDFPAMIFYGKGVTFHELEEMTDRFAAGLSRLGVKKGDRVAIMLPNIPQCVIAFYGALKVGAVLVMTNPLYVERELEFQLNDSGAETLITLDLFHPMVQKIRQKSPLMRIIVTRVNAYLPTVLKLLYPIKAKLKKEWNPIEFKPPFHRFSDLAQEDPSGFVSSPSSYDEVALLQYTGGTTGTPKGVMLTQRNLVANTIQAGTWIGVRPGEDRVMSVLPFFHAYGLTTCLNVSMAFSATMILLPRFVTKHVLTAVHRYRPTIFPGVQAMYVAINNYPDVKKFDLSSIRACISGAGPLHAEVQEKFESLTGGKVVEGYGLTEASPVTHANPINGKRKKGSIGLPFPDTDAKIVDPETGMKELPVGESGELMVRGPQVMKGYWQRLDETEAVLQNGWLRTGDMARMDEEGYFYIVDRKKDMIKTRGENVYPREVEEVLYRH
ncbi:MAG TPA: long-chain fatty acid--CoA ligase, partial [Nitrospiria bacterium]|nr:long-chain fatty acid--CoA ligase [Nitrospiria bacterium]